MRVNIYAEEMTNRVELVSKQTADGTFTGVRFYLELPATVDGKNYQGPFLHHVGDDDSAAVTFWGKHRLRQVLVLALAELDKARGVAPDEPIDRSLPAELLATIDSPRSLGALLVQAVEAYELLALSGAPSERDKFDTAAHQIVELLLQHFKRVLTQPANIREAELVMPSRPPAAPATDKFSAALNTEADASETALEAKATDSPSSRPDSETIVVELASEAGYVLAGNTAIGDAATEIEKAAAALLVSHWAKRAQREMPFELRKEAVQLFRKVRELNEARELSPSPGVGTELGEHGEHENEPAEKFDPSEY